MKVSVIIECFYSDGMWDAQWIDGRIFATGGTLKECLNEMTSVMDVMQEHYLRTPERDLPLREQEQKAALGLLENIR